jgi:hypothetical protein
VVAVAQKLSTVKERLEEQGCLFRTGDYKNKDNNSEKLSWVLFLMMKFSVDQKLSTTEEW